MTPLGSAASNVFNMLNMSFFLVFSTEAFGTEYYSNGNYRNVIFDGILTQLLVPIIDRTETLTGKFRPFLVIGSLVMLFASFMVTCSHSFHNLIVWLGNALVCNLGHWLHLR